MNVRIKEELPMILYENHKDFVKGRSITTSFYDIDDSIMAGTVLIKKSALSIGNSEAFATVSTCVVLQAIKLLGFARKCEKILSKRRSN